MGGVDLGSSKELLTDLHRTVPLCLYSGLGEQQWFAHRPTPNRALAFIPSELDWGGRGKSTCGIIEGQYDLDIAESLL